MVVGHAWKSFAGVVVGVVKEVLVIVPCVLLASAIPADNRWAPVLYGFLLSILVCAIAAAIRVHD